MTNEQEHIKVWKEKVQTVDTCLSNTDVSYHFECIDILIELIYLMRLFYTGQKKR